MNVKISHFVFAAQTELKIALASLTAAGFYRTIGYADVRTNWNDICTLA